MCVQSTKRDKCVSGKTELTDDFLSKNQPEIKADLRQKHDAYKCDQLRPWIFLVRYMRPPQATGSSTCEYLESKKWNIVAVNLQASKNLHILMIRYGWRSQEQRLFNVPEADG